MDCNKSDDSFYDSDQDEQMAAASTQSLFDPCSPYTPVRPKQRQQQPPFLTLSGRRLNSTVCAKATQSVQEHIMTQLSPSSVPPTTPTNSFVKASCYYEEARKALREQNALLRQERDFLQAEIVRLHGVINRLLDRGQSQANAHPQFVMPQLNGWQQGGQNGVGAAGQVQPGWNGFNGGGNGVVYYRDVNWMYWQ